MSIETIETKQAKINVKQAKLDAKQKALDEDAAKLKKKFDK
jgi:hypothetical protein